MSLDPELTGSTSGAPRKRKPEARLIIGLVAVALVIVFAFLNTDRVEVNYLIFERNSRLIYVVIVSAILGALAMLVVRRRGRTEG